MFDINYIYIYIEYLIVIVFLDMELIGKIIISYIVNYFFSFRILFLYDQVNFEC